MFNLPFKNNIFFTSDTHFGHANIIKFSNRPFVDVKEMNRVLVDNWNRLVSDGDLVFHLGDFALGNPKDTFRFLNSLNGRKVLIKGNHEKAVMKRANNRDKFEWIKDYYELKIDDVTIVMSHYAHRVWNKSHHGSIHLYGHSHDSLDSSGDKWGKSMDVGVDSAYRIFGEYRPFSYEEVLNIMNDREIHVIDHHGA